MPPDIHSADPDSRTYSFTLSVQDGHYTAQIAPENCSEDAPIYQKGKYCGKKIYTKGTVEIDPGNKHATFNMESRTTEYINPTTTLTVGLGEHERDIQFRRINDILILDFGNGPQCPEGRLLQYFEIIPGS